MNKLYSERNGLRNSITKTSIIDAESYGILWDCCEKYKINLAYEFPKQCDDYPQIICDTNDEMLYPVLMKAIPDLIYGHPSEKVYRTIENPFDPSSVDLKETEDVRNFNSILDYVEFIAQKMKTVKTGDFHSYYGHHHLSFTTDNKDFESFQKQINETFEMCGLLFNLTEDRIVERIADDDFLMEESKSIIEEVPEKELQKLLEEAVALHKSRRQEDHHLATEKIWDAFERMRSYYMDAKTDKKASADIIINQMAKGDTTYFDLFKCEFLKLGKIGNEYRIRHHETYKTDIPFDDYYDYFFGRCFSLIVLALKYIE